MEKIENETFKIMILDDSQENVTYLQRLLNLNGYHAVNTLIDARLAVETYKQYQPDLLLLDLKMPFLNGFEILEQLCADTESERPAVLMITAENNPQNHVRAIELGVQEFIGKPFDQDDFLNKIRRFKEQRHKKLEKCNDKNLNTIMLKSFHI